MEVELSKVEVEEEVKDKVVEIEALQEPRKSSRVRKQPVRYGYDEYSETVQVQFLVHIMSLTMYVRLINPYP